MFHVSGAMLIYAKFQKTKQSNHWLGVYKYTSTIVMCTVALKTFTQHYCRTVVIIYALTLSKAMIKIQIKYNYVNSKIREFFIYLSISVDQSKSSFTPESKTSTGKIPSLVCLIEFDFVVTVCIFVNCKIDERIFVVIMTSSRSPLNKMSTN